jgi:hypothetical protein
VQTPATTDGVHSTSHPPAAASTTPPCRADDLSAATSDSTGHPSTAATLWQFVTNVSLTNRSSNTCTLTGWVDFTMVGHDYICLDSPPLSGYPQGCPSDHAAHRDQTISRLELGAPKLYIVHPGEHVSFSALWTSGLGGPPMYCERLWDTPYVIELRLPGDQTPIPLRPVPIQPCRGEVAITALGINALTP